MGHPTGVIDTLNDVPDDHVDAVVADVPENANFGNQGESRQAYEVLEYDSELVRYERPFHDFHARLYAWALLFPVHQRGTFEVADSNFGFCVGLGQWPSFCLAVWPRSCRFLLRKRRAKRGTWRSSSRSLKRRMTPRRRSLTRAPWR